MPSPRAASQDFESSPSPATPPVAAALTKLGVPHRVFAHAGPVASLEQAAAERGQQPDQVVRSLLFRLDGDRYCMVLVAGPGQIAWPRLRRRLGVSRVTLATREEVRAMTGYELGAVAPFGLPKPIPLLVDRSVLAHEELSMGSGIRGTAIFIRRDDLLAAVGDVAIVALTGDDAAQEK